MMIARPHTILIMGLPGSGKTTLARTIIERNDPALMSWINADVIRKRYNDWDFSTAGRLRQAKRLYDLTLRCDTPIVIVDFVAALRKQREIFDADFTIWMNTIKSSRYEDTNAAFDKPENPDIMIENFGYDVSEIESVYHEKAI